MHTPEINIMIPHVASPGRHKLFREKIRTGLWNKSFVDSSFFFKMKRYRSGTVNSKFHLIRSFFEIVARFLSFHV